MKENSLKMKPIVDIEKEQIKLNSIVAQGPYFIEPSSNTLYELVLKGDSMGFLKDIFKPQVKPYQVSSDDLISSRVIPATLEEIKPLFIERFKQQGEGKSYWGIRPSEFQFFSLFVDVKNDLYFTGAINTKEALTKKVLLFIKDHWVAPDILLTSETTWDDKERKRCITNSFRILPANLDSYVKALYSLNAKYSL